MNQIGSFRRNLWLLVLLGALSPAATGQTRDLLNKSPWDLICPAAGDASLAHTTVEDLPGDHKEALRITVVRPSEPFYHTMISKAVRQSVAADSRLSLRFWARSTTSNPMRAVVEKNGPPYNSVLEVSATLTPVWKQFAVTGTSPAYGPGGLGVRFQVGHQTGTVELTGIALENLGPDPEIVAARAMVSSEAIQKRIRDYRMGYLQVAVRDAKGQRVRNAVVHIEQTRHAFLFGCNIFGLQPENEAAPQKAYQQRFTALFNYATLPFYWGAFEPRPGETQYARLDGMTDWCLAHGLTPKGHPLVWHEVYPGWAPKTPEEAIPLLHRRVSDIVAHYQGRIAFWDVLNEANNAASYSNGVGAWIKRDGPDAAVVTALDWARDAGRGKPETFIYNDFNTGQSNVDLLTRLRDRNKLPDAIGIQSHMHGGVWPMERVWQIVERFAAFGRPIHFTETTVLSGPPRDNVDQAHPPSDWLTTPEYETRQADYLAQFFTLLFSHPAVRAITYWDLCDQGAWQNAPAGLLRKDMSPKPAYERLMTLIHRVWWTDVRGRTDRMGYWRERAFYGDYRVTATDSRGRTASRVISLPEGKKTVSIDITLPLLPDSASRHPRKPLAFR